MSDDKRSGIDADILASMANTVMLQLDDVTERPDRIQREVLIGRLATLAVEHKRLEARKWGAMFDALKLMPDIFSQNIQFVDMEARLPKLLEDAQQFSKKLRRRYKTRLKYVPVTLVFWVYTLRMPQSMILMWVNARTNWRAGLKWMFLTALAVMIGWWLLRVLPINPIT
ncbi:MAG: hypothetical protein OXH46_09785 [Gemmatimonadetes bacterium]|nr:hypothetical protein [Gemmatimonadota bacterium]